MAIGAAGRKARERGDAVRLGEIAGAQKVRQERRDARREAEAEVRIRLQEGESRRPSGRGGRWNPRLLRWLRGTV